MLQVHTPVTKMYFGVLCNLSAVPFKGMKSCEDHLKCYYSFFVQSDFTLSFTRMPKMDSNILLGVRVYYKRAIHVVKPGITLRIYNLTL